MWWLIGDVVAHWRCGGSSEMWWVIRCVLQTTETVVPGSYPASLTLKNSEDRQSHCVYCKISGKRGRPTPEAQFFFFSRNHENKNFAAPYSYIICHLLLTLPSSPLPSARRFFHPRMRQCYFEMKTNKELYFSILSSIIL